MNRRAFCALAAAFATTRRAHASSALPPTQEPAARLALSTYPFRARMDAPANNRRDPAQPALRAEHFGQFARDTFGLRAVELIDRHLPSTDASYLRELRAAYARDGVRIVNLASASKAQLCAALPAERDAAMLEHRKLVETAVALGCPSLRVRMPAGSDPKASDPACAARAMRELNSYAAARAVLLSLENDSPFTESPAQLAAVLHAVGSANLHVLPDLGNGLADGDAAKNLQDLRVLFPLAYNIAHAKDWETIGGVRKESPLGAALEIAAQAGYRGWFSLESDERADPVADTKRLQAAMLAALPAAYRRRPV